MNKSTLAFIRRFHNLPALVAFSSSFVQMTAGRDSRLPTTAKHGCINSLVGIFNARSYYPSAVSQKYSQTVWRIDLTAGITPQGCSLRTTTSTLWWWSGELKFDIFYFNCLTKALMHFFAYRRDFIAHCFYR